MQKHDRVVLHPDPFSLAIFIIPHSSSEYHAVGESIEQGKLELLRTREEHANKQGELAVKSNKVAELEVELKLLSIRKGILQEQKDSLVQKKQELTEKLVSSNTDYV